MLIPQQPSIVAIVPMRHNSERVPGKNYRLFAGKPLYHAIIQVLQACPLITRIVIDTDSPAIFADAGNSFPDVLVLERPEYLREGAIPMNDVLLHTTSQVAADFYLQTHSTNPLLLGSTLTRALNTFLSKYPLYDSLFTVTRLQTRLWDSLTRAINHNPALLMRTQDLPPIYEENSCLYLFTRQILQEEHNRIGKRPMMFEIERDEAWDIDEEFDFRVAEFLYQQRQPS